MSPIRKRRRTALAAILTIIGLLGIWAVPSVSAATQGTQCSPSDTANTRLHENTIGDTSDGNDSLWLCGSNYPNLSGIDHTLPGNCHDSLLGRGHWGGCASSVTVRIPSGHRLCLYELNDYEGNIDQIIGPKTGQRYNIPSDEHYSLRIKTGSC